MEDNYISKYVSAIKAAKDDSEIAAILNKVYEDGFEDGTNYEDEYLCSKK